MANKKIKLVNIKYKASSDSKERLKKVAILLLSKLGEKDENSANKKL